MNTWQEAVAEFHRKFGVPVGTDEPPSIRRPVLRSALIAEEANECCEAMMRGDLPETIDGLVDTIYVCLGAALEFGVDLAPYFREIHATNMAKVGGPTRDDGKILKPEGWEPPQVASLLKGGVGWMSQK